MEGIQRGGGGGGGGGDTDTPAHYQRPEVLAVCSCVLLKQWLWLFSASFYRQATATQPLTLIRFKSREGTQL